MLYELNVLVNGNSCKVHYHNGNAYIEAKHGSEYEIEIKNHSGNRILAVGSVDGLSYIDGKPATEKSIGYVVNSYSNIKVKGFRYSDEEVGAFKFTNKDGSYAADKGNNLKTNCGVIGVKIISEKINNKMAEFLQALQNRKDSANNNYITTPWIAPKIPNRSPAGPNERPYHWDLNKVYCSTGLDKSTPTQSELTRTLRSHNIGQSVTGNWENNNSIQTNTEYSMCNDTITNSTIHTANFLQWDPTDVNPTTECIVTYQSFSPEPERQKAEFDMGTTWGTKKNQSVSYIDFEQDVEVSSLTIYYASRDALIEMGIIKKSNIALPKAFISESHAVPPKGWRG